MGEIRLLTTVTVDHARLDDFRALMAEAAADSLAEVADPTHGHLGYGAFIDDVRGEVVLYEHHASFDAFVTHLATNPERRARMRELCTPGRTVVLGDPPEEFIAAIAGMGIEHSIYAAALGVGGIL